MARNITITDGSGSSNISNGTYSVTATVTGYDNTSILPTSLTVSEGVNSYDFTIAATGTLTFHVTEDGTSSGTPVVGATFKRADASGNTYGNAITTDSNGDAVMNYVPYATSNAPTIYYVQESSDGAHEYSSVVASTTLTTQTSTVEITNALSASRTVNLTDANYTNLPIDSATITIE